MNKPLWSRTLFLAFFLVSAGSEVGAFEAALGEAQPFSFEMLKEEAKAAAGQPYSPAPVRHAETLETVDFDAHWEIVFDSDKTVWINNNTVPVQFFHLGRYFKEPVKIHMVEGGQAREILYSPDYYSIPEDNPAKALPDDIGFAGFRVMNSHLRNDWMSFLGASYFRTDGALAQYGLSARAVAVDPAMPQAEEFPRFSAFWLAPPQNPDNDLQIMARLEGPSLEGAFRFDVRHDDGTVMNIESFLYTRNAIDRLGLAPLTSMFWYSETNRATAPDWRPEIHDSDGLSIWTGTGEKLWRPLNNPDRVVVSSFFDENIEGYGLLQRDRNFDNFQDDSVFYDRRPSVWVEPLEDWGKGAVQLLEIPTDDEIHDNIAVYWIPEEPIGSGETHALRYRLHWLADQPFTPDLARVVATRIGRGGVPGQPRPDAKAKFVIDFEGGQLGQLDAEDDVELVVNTPRGTIDNPYTLPIVDTDRWRTVFDLQPVDDQTLELRAYLALDGTPLTETWLYQFNPKALERQVSPLRPD